MPIQTQTPLEAWRGVREFFPESDEIRPKPVGSELGWDLNFGEVRFRSVTETEEACQEETAVV